MDYFGHLFATDPSRFYFIVLLWLVLLRLLQLLLLPWGQKQKREGTAKERCDDERDVNSFNIKNISNKMNI